jgi:transcriptional regulator with XRE-family HTH domain
MQVQRRETKRNFADVMIEHGETDVSLSRRSNIPATTIWRGRTGKVSPTYAVRLVLAQCLGVKVDDLVFPRDLEVRPFPFPRPGQYTWDHMEADFRADWEWAEETWAAREDLHNAWDRYVRELRAGGLARGRDFDFPTLLDWLRDKDMSPETLATAKQMAARLREDSS